MQRRKTITLVFVAIALLFSMVLNISAGEASIGWYTKRTKDHTQPLCDAPLRFIEDYGGYYIDKKHGDGNEEKVLYLTFDAGYENGNVEKVLDAMKEENVTGVFFILSNLILKNPELIKRMAAEGHIVANHTSRHPDMTKITNIEDFGLELSKLENIYTECTGQPMPKYYRPPMGTFNETNMKFAHSLGYKTIFWSLAYADWDNNKQLSPEYAKKLILDNIHNGAVILLHPTSATNAAILGDLIRELKAKGYRFGTLDELCAES